VPNERHEIDTSKDMGTGQRLVTTGRAVVQGIGRGLSGEHESSQGAQYHMDRSEAESVIDEWPEPQKRLALQLIEKYGPPNEASRTALFWYDNGPWKRTVLSSDSVQHNWPTPHTDFLSQYIDYRVPPEMVGMISQFDGSIIVDRTRGEVLARCDSEAANVLGMNMVHEIVTGKRTVEDARHTSEQSTVAWNLGRSAPYAERLLFEVPEGGTEDLDRSHISGAILEQAAGKAKDILTGQHEEATDRKSA
jgi:hypothetical protein